MVAARGGRRGDHDRVERGEIRSSPGSVPRQDHDVADALHGQVAAGLRGQVRPDFGTDHARGEPGQQRGLVTVAGADQPLSARIIAALGLTGTEEVFEVN